MALFRGIQEYIALDNIFLYPPRPIQYYIIIIIIIISLSYDFLIDTFVRLERLIICRGLFNNPKDKSSIRQATKATYRVGLAKWLACRPLTR